MPDITARKQRHHLLPSLITPSSCTICQARPWPRLLCLLWPDCLQMKHRHHAPRVRPAPPSPTSSIRHSTNTGGKLQPPPRRRPATAPAATDTQPPTASSTSTSGPSWAAPPAGPCASPPTTSSSSSRGCHNFHTTSPPPPPAPASTSGPR